MKKLFLLVAVVGASHVAFAIGSGPTSVQWKGWSVKSNEMRWLGVTHNGMPLYNLVDGDVKTAWVWSGAGGQVNKFRKGPKTLLFVRDEPFEVDEVRILSGYNKSAALWKRNNRIRTLRISRNGDRGATWESEATLIKTVSLRDDRSWHRISLPLQKVSSVGLSILSEYKGRDNDLCISEVGFYNRGRKIDFQLPRVVAALDGFIDIGRMRESSFDGLVDRRSGKALSPLVGDNPLWFSPTGALVCALNDNEPTGHVRAEVFDCATARRLWRRNFNFAINYPEISWQGAT